MPETQISQIKSKLREHRKAKNWWEARQLLESCREGELDTETATYVRQQLALCTYKDPELRKEAALRCALRDLLGGDNISPGQITDHETAGLAGAVHKRLWELDGRDDHLTQALAYYGRSAEIAADLPRYDPYGAINAAFVLTLQAHARDDSTSEELRQAAAQFRNAVIDRVQGVEKAMWWELASLVEAYVGNGDVAAATALIPQLREVVEAQAELWEVETAAIQLSRLAANIDPPFPQNALMAVLQALAPSLTPTAVTAFGHRFGVALSGGGFRASLFHLGVLAALAEYDLLRHIEALSCVSGGSIVGTAYYSALAQLHQEKADANISSEDLAEVVERCITTMTAAVSDHNIRTSAFFGPITFARGIAAGKLSRTRRGGMLYERLMFRRLRPTADLAHLGGLRVAPVNMPDFLPKRDNLLRSAKVPTLVINATSLGTGRPWRFAATSIGEPESGEGAVDPLDHLDRIWFDRPHPRAADKITVGDAVAASACVPGLFPPATFRGLYADRRIALVDGGVYDNQGISGLLDLDCTEIFVSDASGLMAENKRPRSLIFNVLLRTNSILLSTTRASGFALADSAERSGQVHNLWKIHLLSGVASTVIPPLESTQVGRSATGPPADMWKAIASLRTDLDRFTLGECYALMARGYRLTHDALVECPHPLAAQRAQRNWAFGCVDHLLVDGGRPSRLLNELTRGRKLFLKWLPRGRRPIRLDPPTDGAPVNRRR